MALFLLLNKDQENTARSFNNGTHAVQPLPVLLNHLLGLYAIPSALKGAEGYGAWAEFLDTLPTTDLEPGDLGHPLVGPEH